MGLQHKKMGVGLGALERLKVTSNPALNLPPFSHWTLRDETAQRRSALR